MIKKELMSTVKNSPPVIGYLFFTSPTASFCFLTGKILVMAIFLSLAGCGQMLMVGDSYSFSKDWGWGDSNGNVNYFGKIIVRVKILQVEKEFAEIEMYKTMTPFSEIVSFQIRANLKADRYEFSGKDNWGNDIFGYFERSKGNIEFMIDCNNFSEGGINMRRLYGDKHLLQLEKP